MILAWYPLHGAAVQRSFVLCLLILTWLAKDCCVIFEHYLLRFAERTTSELGPAPAGGEVPMIGTVYFVCVDRLYFV